MATGKTINDYTAANSIDAINDYFLLEQGGVYKRINRSVTLGITGAPVGTSDSQTLSNKTIGNTNTITIKDGLLTLQNSSDITKQVNFSLASVTTGTTRTITLPDASATLATLTGTETLTNKTITGATLSGGTIDNATITVDSISGHTTSTVVVVGGVQMSNGVINTANAVTAASIAAGAVQPNALAASTGTGWAWQSYSPVFTNIAVGNGTVTAHYIQMGKTVFMHVNMIFGSTSSISSSPLVTFPVTSVTYGQDTSLVGQVAYINTGVATYHGDIIWNSTTQLITYVTSTSGAYAVDAVLSGTIPFSFTTGSKIDIWCIYEAL